MAGAGSAAVRDIAPRVFDRPVHVPEAGQYVARGAAYQAAWVLGGLPPDWPDMPGEIYEAPATKGLRERYREASAMVLDRTD